MAYERKLRRGFEDDTPELGAIFMCNRATKKMCFSYKTFGLPHSKSSFVKQVEAGMFLFLFEYETRRLYGVYQACTDGTVNFTSNAFSSAGRDYPAQVKFKVIWYCEPLSEDEFRPAIKDNYVEGNKFKFGLSRNQVWELLTLFKERMLSDASQQIDILPNRRSLIHGATRSPIVDDAGERFGARVLNANSPNQNRDLENLAMPNRKVHDRLLFRDDRGHGNAVADTVLANNRRDFSPQGKVVQVRDMDHKLNSGVPYMPNDEGYDPDAPLINDMTAIQHMQRCREELRTENAVDGRPHFKYAMCDNRLGPLSQHCNSTQHIDNEIAPGVIRQHSATCYSDNAIDKVPILYHPDSSTTPHLNTDFFNDSNVCINDELLNIKPLSENILLPSDIDDAPIVKQPVIYLKSSRTINHPTSTGTKLDAGPILPTSSHSCDAASTHKRSVFSRLKPALGADDEGSLEFPQKSIDDMVNEVMETLDGHYCQLVSESNLAMDQVSDDDDNKAAKYEPSVDISTNYTEHEALTGRQINWKSPTLSFKRRSEVNKTCSAAEGDVSSAILAEKQCKRRKLVRPSSDKKNLSSKDDDKEQKPLEAGNLGSLASATGVENEVRNGIADLVVGPDPSACDAQPLPKQCNSGSLVLDVSLGSRQSASNREDSQGAELSLAYVADDQKDSHAMLENASFGLPLKGVLDHVKERSRNSVDEESVDCTLKLNSTMFSGDKKPQNTVRCDMYSEVKSNDIGDLNVSTEMEMGRAQYLYAAEVPDNGSGKLDHEEPTSTNLLTVSNPASSRGNVRYFEFLTK